MPQQKQLDTDTGSGDGSQTRIGDPDSSLAAKKMYLESGWLGRFFGNRANAPSNIAGLVLIVLLLSAIARTVIPYGEKVLMPTEDYWQIIVPLATLILGYLFGKRSNGN